MKKENKKLKRTKFEEKEFRRLQKAIASLPKPSFNNPEKAQPTKAVSVPKIIPAILKNNSLVVPSEEKAQKIADLCNQNGITKQQLMNALNNQLR